MSDAMREWGVSHGRSTRTQERTHIVSGDVDMVRSTLENLQRRGELVRVHEGRLVPGDRCEVSVDILEEAAVPVLSPVQKWAPRVGYALAATFVLAAVTGVTMLVIKAVELAALAFAWVGAHFGSIVGTALIVMLILAFMGGSSKCVLTCLKHGPH